MKTPKPNTANASSSKLPGNPTSTGTTIWEYFILIYLALEHILKNDARHVEYSRARKQAEEGGGSVNGNHPPPAPRSPLSSDRREGRYETYPSFPRPVYDYSPPKRYHSSAYYNHYPRAEQFKSRFDPARYTEPSKQQMSEAWERMRAVRRTRVEPWPQVYVGVTHNAHRKHGRGVHWGGVQVNEYEQVRYESPPESVRGAVVGGGQRREEEDVVLYKGKGKEDDDRGEVEVWGSVPLDGQEREVWDAVPNEGEIWGSVGPNM